MTALLRDALTPPLAVIGAAYLIVFVCFVTLAIRHARGSR